MEDLARVQEEELLASRKEKAKKVDVPMDPQQIKLEDDTAPLRKKTNASKEKDLEAGSEIDEDENSDQADMRVMKASLVT